MGKPIRKQERLHREVRHYVDYCAGLNASSKQHRMEQGEERCDK